MFAGHNFVENEVKKFRRKLLVWYKNKKRVLPWRDLKEEVNVLAYKVLVSEVMLQQTQVKTVVSYYEKWIKKWPTISHLAAANVEDVNKMWSGLGYYSRGRRLLDLSKEVCKVHDGELPRLSNELEKLPGVGKYTAGAVASIAFKEPVPAVDGNVIRVLCRLRAVGGNVKVKSVNNKIWNIASQIVCDKQPGDFNQALMELGSTVCTPRKPNCDACPVSELCWAFKDNMCDIEDCQLCLPSLVYDSNLGVCNFPQKIVKKKPKLARTAVCVVTCGKKYLLTQRRSSGLLAGLWEFPSFILEVSGSVEEYVQQQLSALLPDKFSMTYICDVVHLFSHIHETYVVFHVHLGRSIKKEKFRWVTEAEFSKSAVSSGMKKVFLKVKQFRVQTKS